MLPLLLLSLAAPAAEDPAAEDPAAEDPAAEDPAAEDPAAEDPAPAEVRGQIDWQAHPAMHIPWPFFARGLTEREPEPSWDHQFRQTVFAPYLDRSGVRIMLAAAMAAERARSPTQARRLILEQLRYVEDFVAAHPDRYALARTPAQARQVLSTTDKTVIVHSIEGGHELLRQPEDARFWADQGVALLTLIHLRDDELGAGAVNPGFLGPLVHPQGARKRRKGLDRGLTQRGRQAIAELGEAGILVDLSHMSPQATAETLALTGELGMPPIVTHGMLATVTPSERALSPEQLVELYRQGGLFALPLNGAVLDPSDPPQGHCPGTLDSFALHYQAVVDLVEGAAELAGLDPTARAVGWSSDWNGWTVHSRPKYGPCRCQPLAERPWPPLEIDTVGLAHPGLLPQHWLRLEQAGVELDPMLRSAERFLQLWERARGER